MSNVVIRTIEEKDIPAIKAAINDVWCFSDLISDDKRLDATIGLYLNQILYDVTYGKVAMLDEKVVGVILGSIHDELPTCRHLLEDATTHAITMLGAPEAERQGVYEYLTKQKEVYEQLSSGLFGEYDGSLDFLVLTSEAQGLGVGKKLWLELKAHFEGKGVNSIYLYSDADCNTGFYEHQGFSCRKEKEVVYDFDGEISKVMNYLYDIKLGE